VIRRAPLTAHLADAGPRLAGGESPNHEISIGDDSTNRAAVNIDDQNVSDVALSHEKGGCL
jgi:hypothetical protein